MNWLTRRQVVGSALLVGAAVVATLTLSPARLLAELAALSSRPVLFGGALLVLYLVRPLFAWPISPISALVGYVLGVTYGVPVALAGAVLTCVPPFLFARYAGTGSQNPADQTLVGRLGDAGRRIIEVTGATRGVLAARLSPLPADPVSYGAGFSGVSTRAFVAGTFLGEIPWVVLEVLAGASMRQLSVHGLDAGLHVIVGSAAVALLVLAGPTYRHLWQDQPG
jgi:uncharacterized membrane protein YdjX (TVP38/TMEM64 family)